MALDPITSLAAIKSELENGWKLFDDVFTTLGPREWAKKFGKTWTFGTMPYHLSYFDGMLATYLSLGASAPADRLHLRSFGELNQWNIRELAKRRPGFTAEEAVAAMNQSRDALRKQMAGMTEKDLDSPAWMPLIFGWTTKRGLLQAGVVHNVAEYWKLWLKTGKRFTPPSAAAVHFRLNFMLNFLPSSMNRELASKKPFTMVWNFSGPGGGQWTIAAKDGSATVSESDSAKCDLRITMDPVDFHRMLVKWTPAPVLMLTGKMKVKGFGAMGTFGKMFPEPKPDQILEPGVGVPGVG